MSFCLFQRYLTIIVDENLTSQRCCACSGKLVQTRANSIRYYKCEHNASVDEELNKVFCFSFSFFVFFIFIICFVFLYSYVLLTGYGCRNKYAATRTRSARERSTSRCVATFNTDSASEWVHLSSSRFDRNSLSSYSYICASHLVTRRSGTSAEEAKGRQASEKVAARNGW